jgi:hypothetical protein
MRKLLLKQLRYSHEWETMAGEKKKKGYREYFIKTSRTQDRFQVQSCVTDRLDWLGWGVSD